MKETVAHVQLNLNIKCFLYIGSDMVMDGNYILHSSLAHHIGPSISEVCRWGGGGTAAMYLVLYLIGKVALYPAAVKGAAKGAK